MDRNPVFTIKLAEEHVLFGLAPVDTLGDNRLQFFRNTILVGTLVFHSDRASTY
jgi:hypothetical protein